MHVDIDVAEIERGLDCEFALRVINFDSYFVIGNDIFLFLGDKLIGVEDYSTLLEIGAQA